MRAVVRAELRRLGRWPTLWILCGAWLVLDLTFAYLFPYLTYVNDDGTGFRGGAGGSRAVMLAQMLPERLYVTMVQGMPMFGGALLMILGALAVGSGYGWGTWKTVFTTGPRRSTALGGTFVAAGLVLAALMAISLVADAGASLLVATAEHQSVVWPSLVDIGRGLGAALLIGGMWLAAGLLLGTLTRGPALAVGLGLVWALVVENLLRGVATLLGPLASVTNVLPGTAAGSLAGALGALPQGNPNGTPGVQTILSGGSALTLLLVYLAAFAALAIVLTARRDVTT